MIIESIIALVVIIIFFIYLGWLFIFDAFELFVNGAVIYAMFLRAYAEIKKENKHSFYLGGAAAAIALYAILGTPPKLMLLWETTTLLVVAFIFAQLCQIGYYIYKKYRKK